jgi:hypothetical protein
VGFDFAGAFDPFEAADSWVEVDLVAFASEQAAASSALGAALESQEATSFAGFEEAQAADSFHLLRSASRLLKDSIALESSIKN